MYRRAIVARRRDRLGLRGLALGLALFDNTGVGSFAAPTGIGGRADPLSAPWTDLTARLLRMEGGDVAALEELVVRVPYGQTSGWEG